MDVDALPVAEFAFPGPLRDRLVAAILTGAKTTTTSLLREYADTAGGEREPLPRAGDLAAVIDSRGRRVCVTEITGVRVCRLVEVTLEHAVGEGEGHDTVAAWRAGHEKFWHSAELRAELGDPGFVVDDDTMVVCEEFMVVRQA